MHALRYHACCFTVSAPSCTLYVDLCIVLSDGRSAELLFKNNSTVRHLLENFPHVTGPVVLRLDQQGQESEGQGHELSRSKPITLAVCQHAGCGWNWEELAGNVPDIRICCIDWTTFVILMKFANYMDWFLICKCCKFCEEIWYISIDRIFPTGYVLVFGAPCIYWSHAWSDQAVTPILSNNNKKAVLPQGNRAMPQVFFSVEVRQQHSL